MPWYIKVFMANTIHICHSLEYLIFPSCFQLNRQKWPLRYLVCCLKTKEALAWALTSSSKTFRIHWKRRMGAILWKFYLPLLHPSQYENTMCYQLLWVVINTECQTSLLFHNCLPRIFSYVFQREWFHDVGESDLTLLFNECNYYLDINKLIVFYTFEIVIYKTLGAWL